MGKDFTEYERALKDFQKKPLVPKNKEFNIFPPKSDIKKSEDQESSVLPAALKLSMRKKALNIGEVYSYEDLSDEGYDFIEEEKVGGEVTLMHITGDSPDYIARCIKILIPGEDARFKILKEIKPEKESSTKNTKKFAINDKIITLTNIPAKIVKVSGNLVFWVSEDRKDFGSDFVESVRLKE